MSFKNIKYVSFLFILTWSKLSFAQKTCSVDLTPRSFWCDACQRRIELFAEDKSGGLLTKFKSNLNKTFFSKDEYLVEENRKLGLINEFLRNKKNRLECSNYYDIAKKFNGELKTHVDYCATNTDMNEYRKNFCEWALITYDKNVSDTFYLSWAIHDDQGEIIGAKAGGKEQIEGAIRGQHIWCLQMKKKYAIKCNFDIAKWVLEFDQTKKINQEMDKYLSGQAAPPPAEDIRKKSLQDACKFFETNQASTFTKDLYLACIIDL